MHLAAFGNIDQPTNRRTVRNRLGQPLNLLPRHELIPCGKQFRKHEKVRIRLLHGGVKETHVSLFDGTLQGFELTDKPAFCFQGHPEASPGPHDIAYLFDRFTKLMAEKNAEKKNA